MAARLAGKHTVVTGTGRGIGEAITCAFIRDGFITGQVATANGRALM